MNLSSKLASRRDNDTGDVMLLCRLVEAQDSVHQRNEEGECLATTGNGL